MANFTGIDSPYEPPRTLISALTRHLWIPEAAEAILNSRSLAHID